MKNTLYEILGVAKEASDEEIQRAYRHKAAKVHPDNLATGNQEQFLSLALARDKLMNPEARSIYDLTGQIPEQGPELPAAIVMIRQVAVECAARNVNQNLVGAIREALRKSIPEYKRAADKYQSAITAVDSRWQTDDIKDQILGELRSRKATMENLRAVAESALELLAKSTYEGIDTPEAMQGLTWPR